MKSKFNYSGASGIKAPDVGSILSNFGETLRQNRLADELLKEKETLRKEQEKEKQVKAELANAILGVNPNKTVNNQKIIDSLTKKRQQEQVATDEAEDKLFALQDEIDNEIYRRSDELVAEEEAKNDYLYRKLGQHLQNSDTKIAPLIDVKAIEDAKQAQITDINKDGNAATARDLGTQYKPWAGLGVYETDPKKKIEEKPTLTPTYVVEPTSGERVAAVASVSAKAPTRLDELLASYDQQMANAPEVTTVIPKYEEIQKAKTPSELLKDQFAAIREYVDDNPKNAALALGALQQLQSAAANSGNMTKREEILLEGEIKKEVARIKAGINGSGGNNAAKVYKVVNDSKLEDYLGSSDAKDFTSNLYDFLSLPGVTATDINNALAAAKLKNPEGTIWSLYNTNEEAFENTFKIELTKILNSK